VKGIISGFLFGCVSLALVSITFGIIEPKAPENFNIKILDSSKFINSIEHGLFVSGTLNQINYNKAIITAPKTSRKLNFNSLIKNPSKLNLVAPNSTVSSVLQINQGMNEGPVQPKIPTKNRDSLIKIKD
jgi:hypothetical protein